MSILSALIPPAPPEREAPNIDIVLKSREWKFEEKSRESGGK